MNPDLKNELPEIIIATYVAGMLLIGGVLWVSKLVESESQLLAQSEVCHGKGKKARRCRMNTLEREEADYYAQVSDGEMWR